MATKFEEQTAGALKTLGMMLDYLGLEATVRGEEKNEKIAIKISSEEAGRIIGRNGQSLENLQYLLNLVMFNHDKEFPRIMLDIDGYAKGSRERSGAPGREVGRGERSERSERGDRGDRPERDDRRERSSGRREGGESGVSEEVLSQQALDAAKEVKRWGDPVTLPAMNAHDRRIIHVTLQDDTELATESEGEGNLKKVVISLKK